MIVLNNRRNRDIDALVKERTELENKKRNLDLQKKNTKDLVKLEEIQVQIDSMTNDWGHLQKQIKDHLAQMEDVKDVSFIYYHREKYLIKATQTEQQSSLAPLCIKILV